MSSDVLPRWDLSTVYPGIESTEFLGYTAVWSQAAVLAIVRDAVLVDEAEPGDTVQVVLDKTPFYGESGGQVGDRGVLRNADTCFEVSDTIFHLVPSGNEALRA